MRKDDPISRRSGKYDRHALVIAEVVQAIHEAMRKEAMPVITPEMKRYPQNVLRRYFIHERRNFRIMHLWPDSFSKAEGWRSLVTRLEYAFDSRGIYEIEKKTGRVLSVAYRVPPEVSIEIKFPTPPPTMRERTIAWCAYLLGRIPGVR